MADLLSARVHFNHGSPWYRQQLWRWYLAAYLSGKQLLLLAIPSNPTTNITHWCLSYQLLTNNHLGYIRRGRMKGLPWELGEKSHLNNYRLPSHVPLNERATKLRPVPRWSNRAAAWKLHQRESSGTQDHYSGKFLHRLESLYYFTVLKLKKGGECRSWQGFVQTHTCAWQRETSRVHMFTSGDNNQRPSIVDDAS